MTEKPVTLHKVSQDEYLRGYTAALDTINKDIEEGYLLIQVPVGSFVVPPTENRIINEHLYVIQEELQTEIDKKERLRNCEYLIVIKEKDDLPPIGSIFKNQGNCFVFNSKDHFRSIPLYLMFNYWKENIVRFLSPSEEGNRDYVEFNINHGDKFVKEVEYNGDGVIKTKITYPDAESAPKTMADIHDDINLMETIVKMPSCTFQKADYNEKYVFLSDYHISSPYINQDIVIKEGTIISLLGGNTYGSENTMVLFPYQNVKIMEEKRLVRRLSPLEICGEPQVCAPAKED